MNDRTDIAGQSAAMDKATSAYVTPARLVGAATKILAQGGDLASATAIASGRPGPVARIVQEAFEQKGMALDTAGYSPAQAQIDRAFVELVRPRTVLGRIRPRAIPENVRIVVGGGAIGYFVGEGEPLGVSEMSFSSQAYKPSKCGAVVVTTSELSRSLTDEADAFTADDLASAVGMAIDIASLDPNNAGSGSTPASLLFGAPAIPSTGASVAQIDADLKALSASVPEPARPYVVMSHGTYVFLSLLRTSGGALAYPTLSEATPRLIGAEVLTSAAARHAGSPGAGFIALMDADQILLADSGRSEIDLTDAASIQMTNTPGAGAQSLVSLWQENLVAIKALRWVRWARRRDGAVGYISNVSF